MMRDTQHGFTILEIIVTILVGAVAATLLTVFMGTAVTKSSDPLHLARDEAAVQQTMENIIADYVRRMNVNATATGVLSTMRSNINGGVYGTGAAAQWISLSSGTEAPGSSSDNTLKVTVTGSSHELVTVLTQARKDGDDSLVMY